MTYMKLKAAPKRMLSKLSVRQYNYVWELNGGKPELVVLIATFLVFPRLTVSRRAHHDLFQGARLQMEIAHGHLLLSHTKVYDSEFCFRMANHGQCALYFARSF